MPIGESNSRNVVGRVAAALLLIDCLVPIVFWANPYPAALLTYWLVGGLAVAAVGLFFATNPKRATRVADHATRIFASGSPLAFTLTIGVLATIAAGLVARFVFDGAASTTDELAQNWHATILGTGRLWIPPDPNLEFFSLDTVIDQPRWYSQFPIGGPVVLWFGRMLGAPWMGNAVFCGVCVAAAYHWSRRWYGELQGRWISVVFLTSPMFILMAGTWMNHVPTLCMALLALVALAHWEESETRLRRISAALCIGLAVGLMATIRPLDAVVIAIVIGVFQVAIIWSDRRRAGDVVATIAGGVVGVLPLLLANAATTGRALRFAYDVAWGAGHGIGFHTDPYGVSHTPTRGFHLASGYVAELNVYLSAWPIPAVALVIAYLAVARRIDRRDGLLLGMFVAQLLAYAAYWHDGTLFGPRFLFTALPALIVFVARAPIVVAERWPKLGVAAVATTVACIVAAWGLPGQSYNALGRAQQASRVRKALRVDVVQAVRDAGARNAVVVLRDPFGSRLARRLWGLGFNRSEAAQLLATRDACSLHAALGASDANRYASPGARRAMVLGDAAMLDAADNVRRSSDAIAQFSRTPMSAECEREVVGDSRLPAAPFGPALSHEPIAADGRIDGDVIYIADLGDHNSVLRQRFVNRTWYRAALANRDGKLRTILIPY